MPVFLVRVVLADRPGALGAVASRIGSVRGDVVGVDIIDRGDGRARDEFMVELPDEAHVSLLVSEVEQVDGATVEQVRPMAGGRRDGRLDAYRAAVSLATERSVDGVLDRLAVLCARELDAEWVAVVEADGRGNAGVLAHHGRPPAPRWLAACAKDLFGSGGAGSGGEPVPEVASAAMVNWDLVLIAGRPGWPFCPAECRRLEALADLADARWVDLARSAHPSRAG